jgi:hypothetical protein
MIEQIRANSDLSEVRSRVILEVEVDESVLSVEEVTRCLKFVESNVPDDMPAVTLLIDDKLTIR